MKLIATPGKPRSPRKRRRTTLGIQFETKTHTSRATMTPPEEAAPARKGQPPHLGNPFEDEAPHGPRHDDRPRDRRPPRRQLARRLAAEGVEHPRELKPDEREERRIEQELQERPDGEEL